MVFRFLVFFFFCVFTLNASASPKVPVVRYFALTNVKTGKVIKGYSHLTKNTVLPAKQFKGKTIGIKVVTTPQKVGSVKVRYLGKTAVLNKQPYHMSKAASKFRLQIGSYLVSAQPFLKKGAKGKRGRGKQIILTVKENKKDKKDDDKKVDPTPTATPTPVIPYVDDGEALKVWANDGGDKVAKEETRAINGGVNAVINSVWNGTTISLFGAKNETVSFNLVLEAAKRDFHNVTVRVKNFRNDNGSEISTTESYDPFNYIGRNIEVFKVKYLQIKGLSMLGYDTYDERHIPKRLRRPYNSYGSGYGSFEDRPDHNMSYPDIAVPQEVAEQSNISQNTNQSFWVDVYIPKGNAAGVYNSEVEIYEAGVLIRTIPLTLEVLNFNLPDEPSAKTMLYIGYSDIANRYIGGNYWSGQSKIRQIRDRHFQMAHRHKISLIDDATPGTGPSKEWLPRLTGELFTPENGYDGVGVGVGNGVYSIGTYGNWNWGNEESMRVTANSWVKWFDDSTIKADYFLYLADESSNYDQINSWAKIINDNSGIGKKLKTFATTPVSIAYKKTPELDIAASTSGINSGTPEDWAKGAKYFSETPGKEFYFYNGHRPQSGSFMTDDDGVALRQIAWTQYKMKIKRWFYWESTYYNNFQAGAGETNVFKQAQTFGFNQRRDEALGETGWNYSNGDGVLFYPGTDRVFPEESYEIEGPIASLRLKHWRRGIQDNDYLTLAAKKNPTRVKEIVQRMIPKVLWEYGVDDINDPSWVRTDISWSINPDDWETARRELAEIILQN